MNENEKKIWSLMIDCDEKYFSDMRFENDELVKKIGPIDDFLDNKTNFYTIVPFGDDLCDGLRNWSIRIVEKFKGRERGRCSKGKMRIEILSSVISDKTELQFILLHEMIHAYEAMYEKLKGTGEILRNLLFLYYYDDLKTKISSKSLYEFMRINIYFVLFAEQQYHSLLFLFKSLNLDLKFHHSLGSIFNYTILDLIKNDELEMD